MPGAPGAARGEIRFQPVMGRFDGIPREANWWQRSSGAPLDGANNSNQFLFNGASVSFLTAASSPWTNPAEPLDVTNDTKITPQDVLALIDEINLHGSRVLPSPDLNFHPPPYFDVTGDGSITPLDVLQVIDYLNLPGAALAAGHLRIASVPEPSGCWLMGTAGVALAMFVRRRRNRNQPR